MKGHPNIKILFFVLLLAGTFGAFELSAGLKLNAIQVKAAAKDDKTATKEKDSTKKEEKTEASTKAGDEGKDTAQAEAETENESELLPSYNEDTGSIVYSCIYYGTYPQTQVTGDSLTDEIEQAEYDSNGDATINGDKYHRVQNIYGTSYFLYEPIKWKVIANENGYIVAMAERGLDYCTYYDADTTSEEESVDVNSLTDEELENYTDRRTAFDEVSWQKSTIRSWLNSYGKKRNAAKKSYQEYGEGFFETAFTKVEQKDMKSARELQAETFSQYLSGENNDKVLLFNVDGVENEAFGFTASDKKAVSRVLEKTDYAIEKGQEANDTYSKKQTWWIDAGIEGKSAVGYVDKNGAVKTSGETSYYSMLVRPVIVIDETSESIKDAGKVAVSNEDGDSISVTLKADTHVSPNEDGTGYKDATVELFVKNIGTDAVRMIDATLEFEDGDTILDGENSVHFASIESGAEKNITWKFAIKPQKKGTTAKYTIKIVGENLAETYVTDEIYIPKAEQTGSVSSEEESEQNVQEEQTFLEKIREFFKNLS